MCHINLKNLASYAIGTFNILGSIIALYKIGFIYYDIIIHNKFILLLQYIPIGFVTGSFFLINIKMLYEIFKQTRKNFFHWCICTLIITISMVILLTIGIFVWSLDIPDSLDFSKIIGWTIFMVWSTIIGLILLSYEEKKKKSTDVETRNGIDMNQFTVP